MARRKILPIISIGVEKDRICYRRIFSILLCICLVVTSFVTPVFGEDGNSSGVIQKIQAEFFVSSTGNDSNPGTYEQPFATLDKARQEVAKINQNMTGDIYVFISAGKYYVNETITFNESDSGTNGYNVIYRNLDELASAEIIGGKVIDTQWQLVERTGADADLPAVAEGKVFKTHVGTDIIFDTLYVNDRRATLARTKNLNKYKDFTSALTPYMKSEAGGIGDLIYRVGDLDEESINGIVKAQERGDLDASVYMWDGGYWDWMTDTIPVSAIDTASRKLVYKTVAGKPEMYRPKYNTGTNARYFIQGNLGFLDIPGEYYFNKTTGNLYYYPEGDISKDEFIIPTVKEIIRVEGSGRDNMVSNIEFSGLQLKDTNTTDWYAYGWNWGDAGAGLGFYPLEANGSTQPSYCEQTERIEFQYGVITLTNTKNITISKVHIKNSGMFGIELYLANQNTTIKDCLIEYTGHGGINVDGGYPGVAGDKNGDGYSRDNLITNVIVHDIGELIGQASGITIQQSSYNTVSNVEVYNSPRRGIFLTAGHSRNPNTAFPNGDKDFNIMTDMYTHHNKIEYAYLHNCQQDGGDDGAFFGCYLYKGSQNYKPNYLNQVIIDNVGANPTMADLGPNCMNLDMGCSGMELTNVKATNPMNFNIEVNTITQYGDVIKFNNVNVNYGTHTNHIEEFDDSMMEYGKIGVSSSYPKEYLTDRDILGKPQDIYFQENFENGYDNNVWASTNGQPKISTEFMSERPINGKYSLEISNTVQVSKQFPETLNKIVTVKMFDRQNNNLAGYDSGHQNSARVSSIVRADDGENVIGMGLDYDVSNKYVLQIGNQKETTDITRTFGWHEFKFDYSSGTDAKLYIDDKLVNVLPDTGFDFVSFGLPDGKGTTYYDELYIYGGKEATLPIGPSEIPEAPEYDGSEVNKQQLKLDFEDGQVPTLTHIGNATNLTTVADPLNAGNKVLSDVIGDGNDFYQLNANWNNYLVNLKWKFEGWGQVDVLGGIYDNFTIYVMANNEGLAPGKAPLSYQVIYRRNKNGTPGFPAGTPYFEICKHTQTSDTSLAKAAVPEGFKVDDWHELQIQTFDGKVGLVIDGNKIASADDGAYKTGGFGFGGINGMVLLDDIEIISNPKLSDYQEDLGLGNATLKGKFNPDYYIYSAELTDATQPVTIIKPKIILNGVEIKLQINGEDVTFDSDIATIPVDKFVKGKNTLVLSEISSAGSKNYTIYINKDCAITSIDKIEDISISVDNTPALPATVNVRFEDETSQNVTINWETINPSLYKMPGAFMVKGKLAGFKGEVSVNVQVDGIKSVEKLGNVSTKAGIAPELASKVNAQYLNDIKELPLTFAEFDPSMYSNGGTIIAVGRASGYDKDIIQVVNVAFNDLISITTPSAITGLANGTAKSAEAFGLPTEVEIETTEGKMNAGVNWNVDAANYDPSEKTTQTFTVDGEVTLPNGLGNTTNVLLTISISVTVNAEVIGENVLLSITTPAAINALPNGTAKTADALKLPTTVTASTTGGSINVIVEWNVAASSYDPSVKTTQTFTVDGTVTLPENVVNTNEVPLTLSIQVTVDAAPVTKTALAAKIATAKALNSAYYTQSSWSIMQSALTEAERLNSDVNATQAEVDAALSALTEAINSLKAAMTPTPTPIPTPTPDPVKEPVLDITATDKQVVSKISTEAVIKEGGKAVAAISDTVIKAALDKALTEAAKQDANTDIAIKLEITATADAKAVEVALTGESLTKLVDSKADILTVSTPIGTMSFDKNTVSSISKQAAGTVTITAIKVETSTLTEEVQQKVGDRPVVSFDINSGDKAISQFGGNVTVTIPYTLKAGENPKAIVAYYINTAGKLETVRNCKYDPTMGTVTFMTTHFSKYAVGYNKVDFNDVAGSVWYNDAVTFAAARGITSGVGNGNFGSDTTVTRAQTLVMVMKAFGINPDENTENNFSDAGDTYYTGYLSAAKRLGITSGVGNNMFAPEKEVTRQEMFTLVYKTLKSLDELPTVDVVKDLTDFKDAENVSDYANEAMTFFVKTGVISGSNGNLLPVDKASRAQFVQILFNIMTK